MIYTGEMLIEEYGFDEECSNPHMRLSRAVKDGKFIRLKRDLYVNDPDFPEMSMAQSLYGPSYISFDYALSMYGVIPEYAYNVTCATYNKHKDKVFKTDFCSFYYTDVPKNVFPLAVELRVIDESSYYLASLEKALCDKLYKLPPVEGMREFEELLFDDLRIYEGIDMMLNRRTVSQLSSLYRCKNVMMLNRFLKTEEVLG